MSPRTTVVAAIVLAALGAYIYFYEREPVEDTDSEREDVFEVEADDIQEIKIHRPEGEELMLQKDGDTWRILEPVEADADEAEVESLSRNIAGLERQRYVAEGDNIDLHGFGLDKPEVEVRFKTDKAGDETALLVGAETPTGTNRYAKLAAENKVFVISSYLKANFDKKPWDLRDKNVLHFDSDDVERVTVKSPEGEVTLAKASEDRWNVTTPSFCRADRYKASSLATRFETAKMEEIVSESADDMAAYGLDPPRYQVDIQLAGGNSVRLQVGEEKDGKFYARDTDRSLVFLVGSSLVDDIKKDASEYRSKRLFDYATYQVDKFQIVPHGETARVYEKKKEGEGEDAETKWVQISPETHEWDRSKVEDLLYKMNGTDAEDFAEDSPEDLSSYGLGEPAYAITVWSKQGESVEELAVGRPEGDWVYARRKGDEPVLKVKASDWEEIEKLMSFQEEGAKAGTEEEGKQTEEEKK